MANWAYTDTVVRGTKEQIDDLFARMSFLQGMETPLVENGFGPNWLGCLVKSIGGDPARVYCRGSWDNLRRMDDTRLAYTTEHAWSRPFEVDDLLESRYPGLKVYFLEEELGMGVFQTNDCAGEFFTETVIIDCEDEGMEYFREEEALEWLSAMKGEKISCWEEAEEYADKVNRIQDESGGEHHLWLHRAEHIENHNFKP